MNLPDYSLTYVYKQIKYYVKNNSMYTLTNDIYSHILSDLNLNNTYFVSIGDSSSKSYKINCGVPQVSILGPTFFHLPFANVMRRYSMHFNSYADDTQHSSHIHYRALGPFLTAS